MREVRHAPDAACQRWPVIPSGLRQSTRRRARAARRERPGSAAALGRRSDVSRADRRARPGCRAAPVPGAGAAQRGHPSRRPALACSRADRVDEPAQRVSGAERPRRIAQRLAGSRRPGSGLRSRRSPPPLCACRIRRAAGRATAPGRAAAICPRTSTVVAACSASKRGEPEAPLVGRVERGGHQASASARRRRRRRGAVQHRVAATATSPSASSARARDAQRAMVADGLERREDRQPRAPDRRRGVGAGQSPAVTRARRSPRAARSRPRARDFVRAAERVDEGADSATDALITIESNLEPLGAGALLRPLFCEHPGDPMLRP